MSQIVLNKRNTPPTPSNNRMAFYVKADGKAYLLDEAGNEKSIASLAIGSVVYAFSDLSDPSIDGSFIRAGRSYLKADYPELADILANVDIIESFERLPNPTQPTAKAHGCAWTPDGVYLAVVQDGAPGVYVWKRSGDVFTRLPEFADQPPTGEDYRVSGVSFSDNGEFLAIGYTASAPYVMVYQRFGDTFTKLADLPDFGGRATEVSFSPNAEYLAVVGFDAPYFSVYKRSGTTFSKLPDPAQLPLTSSYGVSFSPDGNYVAIGQLNDGGVMFYTRSGDTFTKLDSSEVASGDYYSAEFSNDSQYVVFGQSVSPYISVYRRDFDTFTKVTDPNTPGDNHAIYACFALNGTTIAAAMLGSPAPVNIFELNRNNNTLTKKASAPSNLSLDGHACAFTSGYLAATAQGAVTLNIWSYAGDDLEFTIPAIADACQGAAAYVKAKS